MTARVRFPIRFTSVNRAMAVLGIRRRASFVDVGFDAVEVRMGWAFRATIPRAAVSSAALDGGRVGGWGVRGWRGVWLVNGSSSGIVRIEIDPAVRARSAFVPVRLRVLRVSVDDPAGLIVALTAPPGVSPATAAS